MESRDNALVVRAIFQCLLLLTSEIYALNTTWRPLALWNLHGAQNFYPCSYVRATPQSTTPDTIECSTEASNELGNSIPSINPEGKVVREIRMFLQRGSYSLPRKAFEKVGKDLVKLVLRGGQLRIIRREALVGLANLRELEIRNDRLEAQKKRENNGLAGRLFTADGELKNLKQLRRLTLENVDLSDGLAAYAFYDMSRHLEVLRLVGNNIDAINPYAFEKSECSKSMRRLELERQTEPPEWIGSAYRWARDLGSLESVSLSENNLTNYTLDFGYSLNMKLRILKLENCSLSSVPEVMLSNLKELEEIDLGGNYFTIISPEEAGHTLAGVRQLAKLSKISLKANRRLITRQPSWFRQSGIQELDYSASLLRRLAPGELPRGLQRLHLESTHIEEIDPAWSTEMPLLSRLYLNASDLKGVKVNETRGDWKAVLLPLKDQLEVLSLANCHLISENLRDTEEAFQLAGLRLGLNKLASLRHLDLSGNYLSYIPAGSFESLSKLNTLNLSSNHIQTLATLGNYTAQSDPPKLHHLDVTNNALSSLSNSQPSLGFSASLETLLVEASDFLIIGNPLICDCKLRWLEEQRLHGENFTCVGRNKLAGLGFQQVRLHDLINESDCISDDPPKVPNPVYPFRPVRVFGYDAAIARIYFGVKPRALKTAWENIARTSPQHHAFELRKHAPGRSSPASQVAWTLKRDYVVFEVAFWPVGQINKMIDPRGWQVIDEMIREREYVFAVEPIQASRAHIVCFRNAMDGRDIAQSTLCQIFQPSELTMSTPTKPEREWRPHSHPPIWAIILITAGVVTLCVSLLWLGVRCCCRCRRQRRSKQQGKPKPQDEVTPSPRYRSGYLDHRHQMESSYDKLENYYFEKSLPDLGSVDYRPELPKRSPRMHQTSTSSLGVLTGRKYIAAARNNQTRSCNSPSATSHILVNPLENQIRTAAKVGMGSPRLPRPVTYLSKSSLVPKTDDDGYVAMDVTNEDYLEARSEKRAKMEAAAEPMIDSYILGVPTRALPPKLPIAEEHRSSLGTAPICSPECETPGLLEMAKQCEAFH
ncbi:unnamed protein product [Mesocestoides corti]|uniref:LRRCT domain-containing protein n=2 Tax=Mesocestoides corti TaxID=53468 RepID=A0A0R3U535_MESCO|nr:unnamed protein product [Mesocestoides corti]